MKRYLKVPVPLSVDSEALVAENSLEVLGRAEGVLFDCDGVLVDSRESYGRATIETVRYVLGRLGLKAEGDKELLERIDEVKSTGYFNYSVDVARMLLLLAFHGLPDGKARLLGQAIAYVREKGAPANPADLLEEVASKVDLGGITVELPTLAELLGDKRPEASAYPAFRRGLEEALRDVAAKRGLAEQYDAYAWFVGEPGSYGEGLAETVFSDIYYGPLVAEFKKRGPYFKLGEGLYTKETRSVKVETLRRLAEMYGKNRLAVVTGRNRRLAKLVLGELYAHFNDDASVFIADEILEGAPPTIQKPSPYGIIKSAANMGLPNIIYVGDSVEDALMARNASAFGVNTVFVGVTGLAPNPTRARNVFASMGADVILESVDSLPFVVEEAKGSA